MSNSLAMIAEQWTQDAHPCAAFLARVLDGPGTFSETQSFTRHLYDLTPDAASLRILDQALIAAGWTAARRTVNLHHLHRLSPGSFGLFETIEGRPIDSKPLEDLIPLLPGSSVQSLLLDASNARDAIPPLLRALPAGLTRLTLDWAQLTAEDIDIIRDLPDLTELSLHGSITGAEGAERLTSGRGLRKLTRLNLDSCRIESAGLIAVASSPIADNLTHLGLNGCIALPDGVAAILTAPRLEGLVSLGLRFSVLSGLDLRGRSLPALRHLTHLGLSGPLPLPSLHCLLDAPCIPNLQSLYLQNVPMTAADLEVLLERLGDAPLRELDLEGTHIGSEGMARLARWPGLSQLDHLAIGRPRADEDDGYRALLTSPHPLKPGAMHAHVPSRPETAFAMALHPGVRSNTTDFAREVPLKTWQDAARAVGITPKKSHSRSRLVSLLQKHNENAPPSERLSLWSPPISL